VPTFSRSAAPKRSRIAKWLCFVGVTLLCACATSKPLPDPCSLLTVADVEQAQGNAYVDATKSVKSSGGVTVSQCYFRLPEASRSVTLELTRAASPHATRELWERQFESKEKEKGDEGENETHGVEVKGIGDDAIWSGNRVSGALYVLTKDTILRISLGGIGTQELKVERAKMLARRVLPKLSE
jgi:hypothetical protein